MVTTSVFRALENDGTTSTKSKMIRVMMNLKEILS